jgi:hypothetical protein
MPHYKDGTPAQAGDIVKGQGYNTKHEIIGVVLYVNPGTEQCNISVAHVMPAGENERGIVFQQPLSDNQGKIVGIARAKIDVEYGQTDAFEKIG